MTSDNMRMHMHPIPSADYRSNPLCSQSCSAGRLDPAHFSGQVIISRPTDVRWRSFVFAFTLTLGSRDLR